MGERRILALATVVLALVACGSSSDDAPPAAQVFDAEEARAVPMDAAKGGGGAPARPGRRKRRPSAAAPPMAESVQIIRGAEREEAFGNLADADEAELEEEPSAPEEEPARVRSWFPDAFVWQPAVVTDEDGRATVPVRVPDTLTDWRVLGLAHDRTGQQAGALTSFASRLPVSADPRLPSYLFVGDVLDMPVRATNGTDDAMTARLEVLVDGALSGGGTSSLALGGRGVGVQPVRLTAREPGMARVRVAVAGGGHLDRSERNVRVTPIGRPVTSTQRGVLAAETVLALPELAGVRGPEGLDVTVFPGPMALVQAEVDRFAGGARSALPGAALQAIDHLLALAEKTGAEVDPATLRRLKLLAWQQLAREVRSPDWKSAVGLLRAVGTRDLVGAVESARPGLVSRVKDAQKPDGTWSSAARSTLQQVLVETATAAMVLPPGAHRLKAEGAVERQLPNIEDPYTAAVLVGSGVLHGPAADPARTIVREALVRDDNGVPRVQVPDGVVDAWGQRPTGTAMLAWTVLALQDDPEATADRGMLAAELIGTWARGGGFGAGRADPIALLAVVRAVPGASGATTVRLMVDGQPVASGVVDPGQPGVPLVLTAESPDAVVELDPPVDGLAYTATRRGYAPWSEGPSIEGFDWAWKAEGLRVGEMGQAELTVSAPRSTRLTVEVGLPAGAEVDGGALDGQAHVAWSEVLEDRVRIGTQPLPGTGATITVPVKPSFAGTFHSVPLRLTVQGQGDLTLPGRVWTVQ
jgi:hypothetical protein